MSQGHFYQDGKLVMSMEIRNLVIGPPIWGRPAIETIAERIKAERAANQLIADELAEGWRSICRSLAGSISVKAHGD